MINIKKISAICDDKDLHEAFKENYLLLEEVVEKAGNDPERLDTKKLLDESLYCYLPIKLDAECNGKDLDFRGQATDMREGQGCNKISVNVSSTKFASRSR